MAQSKTTEKPLAIVVHGGAGPDSPIIQQNPEQYTRVIKQAVEAGYAVLEKSGSAVEAVEAAVKIMEDCPLFNAGRGAALNSNAEVEMDAAIMDGKDRRSGAVATLRFVRNPIALAKAVMLNTDYRFLGDMGALAYAKKIDIALEPTAYFITEQQYDAFNKNEKKNLTAPIT